MVRTKRKAKLPVQQLIVLAICRCAEPITATSIHPYLPEMIRSFGIPVDEVAKYTGLLAATFFLSACVTAIAWGRASDRLGRKPMILLALGCIMFGNLCFGFSTSLKMAFASRLIQGLASGDVGIIRTAVAEMVPQKELQPRAFTVMPLVWVTGSIIGPIIGGNLVHPVSRFGGVFKKIPLLQHYPYAFPNLVTSVMFLIGILSGFLFLRETHQDKKDRKDYGLILGKMITGSRRKQHLGRERGSYLVGEAEREPLLRPREKSTKKLAAYTYFPKPAPQPKVGLKEVLTRQSCINLVVYAGLAMHTIAYYQILPVFMNYPRHDQLAGAVRTPLRFSGGFGLRSDQIGLMYTTYGIFGMCVQFLAFPAVTRKYGPLRCLKVSAIILPVSYFLTPFTSLIESRRGQQGACMVLMLIKCLGGAFSFPCSTILLTNSASSLRVLGSLNGVATSLCALGQAIGPALAGAAFTFGVNVGYIVIPFWVITLLAILSAIPVWWLVEPAGFGSRGENEDGDGNESANDDEDEDEDEDDCDEGQEHEHEHEREDSEEANKDGVLENKDKARNYKTIKTLRVPTSHTTSR